VYKAAVATACKGVGVSSSRIKFSAPVGIIKFIERLGAADVSTLLFFFPALFIPCATPTLSRPQLFIDTVPLGAHTVAMDGLALGTPLIAVPGKLYAHRVSSSILAAAGGNRISICVADV
jgi:predicted O-linked N-acetylglucosamine transferase (SPINDLY family)